MSNYTPLFYVDVITYPCPLHVGSHRLRTELFSDNIKYMLAVYIFLPHIEGTASWNPSSKKTSTLQFNVCWWSGDAGNQEMVSISHDVELIFPESPPDGLILIQCQLSIPS